MNLTAVLLLCPPERLEDLESSVAALPWAQIHSRDPVGKALVVLEGESSAQDQERFGQLAALTFVSSAQMIEYWVDLPDPDRPLQPTLMGETR
ncbi:MAG: hypothetical protein A2600_07690 [Candidatus Lambdaproteobacteria bacterium RIFOXYD1_FULL_56_27]|uniref:Chaperone NapD n=1 Tax=Candidatus Lambdaproteobacteria bacterium RIFOXYD2_FULL_56_26 TaxID=1817773 RepID=A0A1F6GZQ7_9PROT|nr:MAG: hypothetical protein A2426_08330 [Candidatus Lambdaproteobacteria bacterium RIFOXYC1_FULL_56_13]OGH03524.1 MAG: hypothetical protein A2557_01055 [Candidatus Lambdaproteobacteria bacterium RIFOXYD2_FULL_56_26]OGH09647.1 MAG: hypothetical protein A2600_07690 [Candidatus Lambdaproteobacteria bacterium RIFOXYD1_FULL_56_27]